MARISRTGTEGAAAAVLTRARAMSTVGPLLALVLAATFFTTRSDRFLTTDNLSLGVQQVAVVGIIAIGQTLIILTAGIDLSCGAVMAFGTIVMTRLAVTHGLNPFESIAIGLGTCTAFGVLNGLLVTGLRLPPFIVTLGTLNIAFALTPIASNEAPAAPLPTPLPFFRNTFQLRPTPPNHGSAPPS